ncbi:hypothetical protein GON01_10850 [Sphingomonas sp. MAH-20]|uniref:Uncharacterized protein n=1 Tax=Sphingomonas horti TaxID=2682842 RepID=A0A6I4J1D6_9SPHN|nr:MULTISPECIES: hypothetical protein [Sphingomonas]MBA2919549.1 hypothetical protein [Sphingomonas sp. CGMCC 1.13658]MVO78429.1 hypothetical protein [Sphingomonas horti]
MRLLKTWVYLLLVFALWAIIWAEAKILAEANGIRLGALPAFLIALPFLTWMMAIWKKRKAPTGDQVIAKLEAIASDTRLSDSVRQEAAGRLKELRAASSPAEI